MNYRKLSALTVLAASIPTTAALANVEGNSLQRDLIQGSKLDLSLRNVYFNFKSNAPNKNWSQWAQGMELNYKSGYFADFIGFDMSYYGSLRLAQTGIEKHGLMGGQLLGKDSQSYQKLGQAFIKIKASEGPVKLTGKAGYTRIKKGFLSGSSSRATPSSYRGAHGELSLNDDLTVYGSYIDRIGFRTENRWEPLVNAAGDRISYAAQLGGTYKRNNLTLEAMASSAKDYQKQYAVVASHTFDLNEETKLTVDGNFHYARDGGSLFGKKYKNGTKTTGFFDSSGHHINLNTRINYKSWSGYLSYGQTTAKKTGGLGTFDYFVAYNEYGAAPTSIGGYIGDFLYHNEKSWQTGVKYNFAQQQLPGLDLSANYIHGSGVKDLSTSNKVTGERETYLTASYAIKEGSLKGLGFKAVQAWYAKKIENQKDVKMDNTRVYIDYTVNIF